MSHDTYIKQMLGRHNSQSTIAYGVPLGEESLPVSFSMHSAEGVELADETFG
jgi:hypothetical protein